LAFILAAAPSEITGSQPTTGAHRWVAVGQYNRAVEVARTEGDNASRELFERLLKDEEKHVDWLEAQMHQIKELGYERYLTQQIKDE